MSRIMMIPPFVFPQRIFDWITLVGHRLHFSSLFFSHLWFFPFHFLEMEKKTSQFQPLSLSFFAFL
jgi:hypothetical protein